MQKNQKNNFFLWLHYLDPHAPFQPPVLLLPPGEWPERIGVRFEDVQAVRHGEFVPTAAEQAWIRKLYEAEVRYVDSSLGKLLRSLKELGLYDDALIILASDHGEEFWEHGSVGHGHTLYEELLRVPLIIKLSTPPPFSETNVPVALPALMPTLLDLCRVEYEPAGLSFTSLLPLWEPGATTLEPQPIVGHLGERLESVLVSNYKYIRSLSAERPGEELYDLARDPAEKNSLVDAAPEKVQQARELLEADSELALELGEALGLESILPREIPEDLMEKLKALGYLR